MRALALATVVSAALAACSQAPKGSASNAASKDPGLCAECHMPDYQRARHHVGEKPTTCGVCHEQSRWHPRAVVSHEWPLTGKHATAKCMGCHTDGPNARTIDKACVACHASEFERAPEHVGHFPVTCAQCHTTDAWKPLVPEPVWPPRPPEPKPEPEPAASASASAAPSASAPPKPKPKWVPPPKPTAPKPPPTHPPIDPTSNASRR